MVCKQCGYQSEEGMSFCQNCGAQLTEAPLAQPDFAQPDFAELGMEAPVPKTKKSKKRGWILAAIISGTLIIGVAACILFWPWARGAVINAFGSNDDYLQFVQEEGSKNAADKVVEAYGKYLNFATNPEATGASKVSAQIRLGDKSLSLVKNALESEGFKDIDTSQLEWLKNVSLELDSNLKNSAAKFLLTMSLNNTAIANADVILDMDKGEVFAGLTSLSDKYFKAPIFPEEAELAFTPEKIKEVLPTEVEMATLIEKYTKLFRDSLVDAEKTTETVSVGNVSQKLTVLKVELDARETKQIIKTYLDTIQNDEIIKNTIIKAVKAIDDENVDANEVYEEFREGISEAKESLNDVDSDDMFDKLWISFYVDDSHEIVGRKYKIDSESVYYVTVRDGKNFAYEMSAGELKINGSGTEKSSVVNGTYTIEVDSKDLINITLTDFSDKNDLYNGKISIKPTEELLELVFEDMGSMGQSVSSIVSLIDPAVEFVFNNTKDAKQMEINLVSGENLLIGLTLGYASKPASDIAMPSSDKIVEDEYPLTEDDLQKVLDKLKEAGVPEVLLEGFRPSHKHEVPEQAVEDFMDPTEVPYI